MTYLTSNQAAILRALRKGALTLPAVADAAGLAPYTARAELLRLKNVRLVTDGFYEADHLWELTVTGCGLAWSGLQLELVPEPAPEVDAGAKSASWS